MPAHPNSFGSRATVKLGGREFEIHRLRVLDALPAAGRLPLARLPFSLRVLLENLLRHEDGVSVTERDVRALLAWDPAAVPSQEIAFRPARVLLQDFTGVPAVVDLAAMRDAMVRMGGDPARINPLEPVELVIDHSVQVDAWGSAAALATNIDLEYARNRERYTFLRWGQGAFRRFTAVPPGAGIVHQVNLEHLARVVFSAPVLGDAQGEEGKLRAYPDTLVGTDSHTTMVNGLGVLGWGVGGIEAEAAMLGQPVSMLLPQVVGFRLVGGLRPGATATDLVLTVTQQLRARGVVGKFVEFFGPGLRALPLADRATIANMAPEYGATCGFFPVDAETLRYLRLTGRSDEHVALVEAYLAEQGLLLEPGSPDPAYSDTLELDLGSVEPSVAGPRRPQDRVALGAVGASFRDALPGLLGVAPSVQPKPVRLETMEAEGGPASPGAPATTDAGADAEAERLRHGSVVIAAITSCTNTSNPSVMLAAGLLAKKAVAAGLKPRAWVKGSLAPGSRVVTAYLKEAGLLPDLEALGFHVVGYGCTTCIGNSGPLPPEVARAVEEEGLVVAAVLSGNRNFEGRINADVRANYLMSPPLVVAFALAGRVDLDLTADPIGRGRDGRPVYLRELWPSPEEVAAAAERSVRPEMFASSYASVLDGDSRWREPPVPSGETFAWEPDSTYIRHPPYFSSLAIAPDPAMPDLHGARLLALLGDSVTTDHISPAGSIKKGSPAARYLVDHGVSPADFNSYGSRRGNHEVMVRGTFANVRLRNRLAPGTEGGFTALQPAGTVTTIFEAAEQYRDRGVPLLIVAGAEYGTGSSRDWAAKGPALLGVRAVLAKSFERIHRSNLVGMGIAPLQFAPGEDADTHGLRGDETYDVVGVEAALQPSARREVTVTAAAPDGKRTTIRAQLRIDTPQEVLYYRNGGILPYVLRQLLGGRGAGVRTI